MSNIYLDRESAQIQISCISEQAQALENAAISITNAMTALQDSWKGASAQRAQQTYDTEYRVMLQETIPGMVREFRMFVENCVQAIYETDMQLSG